MTTPSLADALNEVKQHRGPSCLIGKVLAELRENGNDTLANDLTRAIASRSPASELFRATRFLHEHGAISAELPAATLNRHRRHECVCET